MSQPTTHQVERAVAKATELTLRRQDLCSDFETAVVLSALTLQLARELEAVGTSKASMARAARALSSRTLKTAFEIRRDRVPAMH